MDIDNVNVNTDNLYIPRRIVFVIDKSGSMRGSKWDQTTLSLINGLKELNINIKKNILTAAFFSIGYPFVSEH